MTHKPNRTNEEPHWWRCLVGGVFLAALLLRLISAAESPLTGDERNLMRFVQPTTAGLPLSTLNHPPLALLMMWVPVRLGLTESAQVRLPFVLMSILGLAFVYRLGREGFGRWPALMGVAILAVDPFHLVRSRTASEAVALAFVGPVLYTFHRAVNGGRSRLLPVCGVLLGIGYYAKEDLLLLVPAMTLFLLARRGRRRWFRRRQLHLAAALMVTLVAADLYLNVTGRAANLHRAQQRIAGLGLTLRATSLYLGELLIRMVDDPARFVWVEDRFSWEVPAMNWIAGLICLAAVIQATGRYRDELTSLLLWVFWVVFAVVSMVAPVHGFFEMDLKKWAGASVVPAALLAGEALHRRALSWRLGRVLTCLLFLYLLTAGVKASLVRDNVYSLPPQTIRRRPEPPSRHPSPTTNRNTLKDGPQWI